MSRSLVRALPLIALTIVLLSPSRAEARRRGLVLITHGESVKHVAEIPADKQAVLRELTHVDTDVGYLYSSFGVFWLDIWTWDGKYCLYEGDNVWVLEPSQAADVLDVSEGDLSKPLMYTFPPGLMIIAAIAVIWIGSSIRGKRQEKQLIGRFESLMDDSRYKRALEILQEHVQAKSAAAENASDADASVPAETDESSADDGGYQAAIQHLVDNGIDRAEAEENLNFVLSVLVASSQSAA